MGGEAILGYHYIRALHDLGVEFHALTHARVRDEINDSPIRDAATFHYVEDAWPEIFLFKIGNAAPAALRETVFNTAIGIATQTRLTKLARALENEFEFDVIHQPTPVSPQLPSFLAGLKTPVIIGPLNGAMSYPPAFEKEYAKGTAGIVSTMRSVSTISNKVIRGKRDAARILVANERTRDGLPKGVDPNKAELLVENGVDLNLWTPQEIQKPAIPRFVFVGRLVWWKAVELLVEAFGKLDVPAELIVIGDGPERERLEGLANQASTSERPINFTGFKPQQEIRDIMASSTALVLPSMRECGGAVILEAFACGAPAIATKWGGPQDYITPETGFLIEPDDRTRFIDGLAQAMKTLAKDQQKADAMGHAARKHVEDKFSWRAKAERMLDIYKEVSNGVAQ